MAEVRLFVSSESENHYRFRVRSETGEYQVEWEMSSGWQAQLQRLHWKAGNLLPEEDAFLAEVSAAIGSTVFIERDRLVWEPLLSSVIDQFIIEIEPRSQAASSLPFELISIDGRYLVDVPGLKIVREISSPQMASQSASRNPEHLRVLHVSLGTDANLNLRQERAQLLQALAGTPLGFLVTPTLEVLTSELKRFRPTVVHVSSHGSFDILTDNHSTDSGEEVELRTADLLRQMHDHGVRAVFLASCQSGLFVAGERQRDPLYSDLEIAGFTFPVQSDTARLMMAAFYGALRKGQDTTEAILTARNANLEDVFSSFSLVHYRPHNSSALRFAATSLPTSPVAVQEFIGSEEVILRLDGALRMAPKVHVLAPVGFGAETVLHEWARLQHWNDTLSIDELTETQITFRFVDEPEPRIVQIIRYFDFAPKPGWAIVVVGQIGDFSDNSRSASDAACGDVGWMAAEIPRVAKAIADGESANAAVQAILLENRLDERLAALSKEARQLLQELIGLGGVSTLPLNPLYGILSFDGEDLLAVQSDLVAHHVAVELGDHFIVSPEIMFLADGLFPKWREPNRKQLVLMAGAFAQVHEKKPISSEDDFTKALCLLQWASNLQEWEIVHELLLICQAKFAAAGRSSALLPFMAQAQDHLSGMEQMIHEGNLGAFQSNNGAYTEGLRQQEDLQKRFEALPEHADRARNVSAAKTQQMNLLIQLGRADEAIRELPGILKEVIALPEAPPSAEAHVLGLLAEAHRANGDFKSAAKYFNDALSSLDRRGATNERPIFLYSLSSVLLQDDDVYGSLMVFKSFEDEMEKHPRPELLSNLYHQKGKLLSEIHDPDAGKYLLKSFELDVASGNTEAALVSWLSVMHHAQFSEDQTIHSMLPVLRDFGAKSEDPRHLEMIADLEKRLATTKEELQCMQGPDDTIT
jgi:tetratricopeptide (TPR) repeat protein